MADHDANDISDILETLDNLEDSIMGYEDSLNSGEEDTSLIHIIFRYAHNLKSSLAMAHKQHSSELIHAVESEFDLIRSGKATADAEVVDKSLASIDLIKENLTLDTETEEELKRLQGEVEALQETTKSQKLATITFPLSKEQQNLLEDAEKKGQSIYQIEKLVTSDIDEDNYHNLPIYLDIEEVGFLIATYPPFEKLDRSKEQAVLKILFAGNRPEEELFYDIFDPFRRVNTGPLKNGGKKATAEQPAPSEEKSSNDEGEARTPTTELTEQEKQQAIEQIQEETIAPKSTAGELNILIVEDDFVTRHLEVSLMSEFGNCEVAVNGPEAVRAFEVRLLNEEPYDLIILDILIPLQDGHEVLTQIRQFEDEKDIQGFDRTKVIIVSNLKDMDNISKSFRGQSDSYIVKPITKKKIFNELKRLKLL